MPRSPIGSCSVSLLHFCNHTGGHVTESKLALLATDGPMNQRRGVDARKTTLPGKPADREDGGLESPKNHLIGVWMPVSFIVQRAGGDEDVQ